MIFSGQQLSKYLTFILKKQCRNANFPQNTNHRCDHYDNVNGSAIYAFGLGQNRPWSKIPANAIKLWKEFPHWHDK
jgi:hypothetical protein